MRAFITLSVVAVVLLAACGGNTEAPATEDTQKAEEAAARIHVMEDSLFKQPTFDSKGAQALLDVYLAYAKTFPLDTLTPEYLFRAAGGKNNLGDPRGGIGLYDRIIKNYPSWRKTPDAYYLKALSLDKDLHQLGEAKTAYQAFINEYPEHPFVNDAKRMMEYLGLTDEELIKKFQEMNKDSAQASK
jgi:outer membrane protein assembly factor BamD (BamD/ComL family)